MLHRRVGGASRDLRCGQVDGARLVCETVISEGVAGRVERIGLDDVRACL